MIELTTKSSTNRNSQKEYNMLEIVSIISTIVTITFTVYLCRISHRRQNLKLFIAFINLFVIYVLLITLFYNPIEQIIVTVTYSLITYKILIKYIALINKEHNEAILDRMETSYQKYAVKLRRRND